LKNLSYKPLAVIPIPAQPFTTLPSFTYNTAGTPGIFNFVRKTLASIAYDSIKAGIVSGEINNNLLLSENTLAKIIQLKNG